MIISLDIDGTITNYTQHWLDHIEQKTGKKFGLTKHAKSELGHPLYAELKHSYRLGPEKFDQPVIQSMRDLTHELYRKGVKIYFNSSRPFEKYPKMQQATRLWLKGHDMMFEDVQKKSGRNLNLQRVQIHVDDEISEMERMDIEGFRGSFILVTQSKNLEGKSNKFLVCQHEFLSVQLQRLLGLSLN